MTRRARNKGAALVTALCVLLALMILALSAAQSALNAEKSARNERDRDIAFQAAEAGLSDAERDIEGGANPASARAALFSNASALGFVDGCGRDPGAANSGLCQLAPPGQAPAWQLAELAGPDDASSATTPYGKFTGAVLPTGGAALPAKASRYIIELIPLVRAGEDAGAQRAGNLYRITAIGFGVRLNTQVVLQSSYRKIAPLQGGVQ